jgi:Rrf2 family iron-sulfur cluster assembly transcriptional regulator
MKLNKKLELGISAVEALKKRGKPTRTVDLATEIGTTLHFLQQIMRNLHVAGIVTSIRGPGGGYTLDTTKQVTALQVAEAVGRKFSAPTAGLTFTNSPNQRLQDALTQAFQNTTI